MAGRLHAWLGLTVGLVLSMCGLTGSYLAFYQEIERAALPALQSSAGVRPHSYEAVYRALHKVEAPERGDWNIELPAEGGVITSRLPGHGGQRMVSLDPATLTVVRDVRWGGTVSTWIYELHYRLLMGRTGATVMGIVGLAIMALLMLGTVLWWRSGRSLRSRVALRVGGPLERTIHDAHRLLGVGSLGLLLIVAATATAMSLPRQVRPLLQVFSAPSPLPRPVSDPEHGRPRIPVDAALAAARAVRPDADLRWIKVPSKPEGAYEIRFWQAGEPGTRFPKSQIWVDRYDGRVLAIHDGPRDSAGDRIQAWFYPLHSGEVFGLFGRVVVALLGLVPAALFITGLIRWRGKQARLSAHRQRSQAAVHRKVSN